MIDMLSFDGSEDDCLRRAQAGDRKAFSELVRRHQRPVHRYLLRMLGSHDDAMELTQEAFIKAWQALPQWRPEAQFRTWLFRIANNTALDALRHRKLIEFVPLKDSFDAPGSEPDPAHQAQVTQEVRQLEATLKKLAPHRRRRRPEAQAQIKAAALALVAARTGDARRRPLAFARSLFRRHTDAGV